MVTFLIILQFVLAGIITIAVLLQKSSSIGLGAYSGSNESLFGAKGPMGFLAKFTFIMGIVFIINTLSIGYLYSKKSSASVVDSVNVQKLIVPQTKEDLPTAPAAPISKPTTENNSTK